MNMARLLRTATADGEAYVVNEGQIFNPANNWNHSRAFFAKVETGMFCISVSPNGSTA
jgi:hypothetical protein